MARTPLICVTPPCFALSDLRVADGTASAVVLVQTSAGLQSQTIGLPEVGRHLAVLGLCAAASTNPALGRHYYLAHHAEGEMFEAGERLRGPLRGHATVRSQDRRSAEATTELTTEPTDDDGTLIARIDIRYQVLNPAVFRRLMGEPSERDAMFPATGARWRCGAFRLAADHHLAAGRTSVVEVAPTEPQKGEYAFHGVLRTPDRTAFQMWVDYDLV